MQHSRLSFIKMFRTHISIALKSRTIQNVWRIGTVVIVIVWWIYNYPCNQYLPPLKLWVRMRGVLYTALCDTACQWLATCRWFSPGPPVSSSNKSDHHDIAGILLKVTLITHSPILGAAQVGVIIIHHFRLSCITFFGTHISIPFEIQRHKWCHVIIVVPNIWILINIADALGILIL